MLLYEEKQRKLCKRLLRRRNRIEQKKIITYEYLFFVLNIINFIIFKLIMYLNFNNKWEHVFWKKTQTL
jgi:hypothetical protein